MRFPAAVSNLRIEKPNDDARLEDWRSVHNTIIPTAPLSSADVRERVVRNHLEVAYLDDQLVGCTTLRPPTSPRLAPRAGSQAPTTSRPWGFQFSEERDSPLWPTLPRTKR